MPLCWLSMADGAIYAALRQRVASHTQDIKMFLNTTAHHIIPQQRKVPAPQRSSQSHGWWQQQQQYLGYKRE